MVNLKWTFRFLLLCTISILLATYGTIAQGTRSFERVLIQTPKPYDSVVGSIQSRGGRVTKQFKNVNGIAAEIPSGAMDAIRGMVGPAAMMKDEDVPAPRAFADGHNHVVYGRQIGPAVSLASKFRRRIPPSGLAEFAARHPGAYLLNNGGLRLERLHARGFTGAGTVVAVIDSGVRPGFPLLDSDESILPGIDLVRDGVGPSDPGNDGHGTFVAGLISGHADFDVSGRLQDALTAYAPGVLDPETRRLILIGSAPSAQIFPVRVFGPQGSASLSLVLDAIDQIIEIRKDFNRGHRGLRIDVCNLSLGFTTLEAGRTLIDQSVDAMLDAGIIPVVAGGNTGPSSLTTASPGSAHSAVTVGGISRAINERILSDLFFETPGLGALYRPFDGTETAWFSSRGPDPDGRIDPDVVASAVGNIGQGYCPDQTPDVCAGELSLASGTSFSTPIVSGLAAVLRQAFPEASATAIRNAIIDTAKKRAIADGSIDVDRGQGAPDAVAAYNMLKNGDASDRLPHVSPPSPSVEVNIERNTDFRVRTGPVQQHFQDLKPGQRGEILYNVGPGTRHIVVTVSNIVPALPAEEQNPIFGDGLSVDIHSAKTSQIHSEGDYLAQSTPREDTQFEIDDPDTGIVRITVSGDTVNAGTVSADVSVDSTTDPVPKITARGLIRDKQSVMIPFQIPAGVNVADFLLSWNDDWSHYPTSDIDLQLVPPAGDPILTGATLAEPERVSVTNPVPGIWLAIVVGFDIPDRKDNFQLRVLVDGKLLK